MEVKRSMVEGRMFAVLTGMLSVRKSRLSSQGMPRPKRISKTLEPIALVIAMSPRPWRETMMEDKLSGTEVPIASTVRATMDSGIWRISAMPMADSTKTQLRMAMAKIEEKKTTDLWRNFLGSSIFPLSGGARFLNLITTNK